MIDNKVITVSNYATEELQRTLDWASQCGYKLASAVLAPNKYGVDVMYLFFVMEVK